MDRVEQVRRICRLVRLEPADGVQPDARMTGEQRRPFRKRLLDTALAEVALANGDQRLNLFGAASFADGNQLDISVAAPSDLRGGGNSIEDSDSAVAGIAHVGEWIGRVKVSKSRHERPFARL